MKNRKFMFRIGDKVVCINIDDLIYSGVKLTLYKIYNVVNTNETVNTVSIKDDNDNIKGLYQSRFISLKEYRKQKINEICLEQEIS